MKSCEGTEMLGRLKYNAMKWIYLLIASKLPSSYLPGWEWTRGVRGYFATPYLDSYGKNINIEPRVKLNWGGYFVR